MLTDFRNGVEGSIMNASRHREVACAIIIDTSGRFLLQQRDDVVGILHPGKVDQITVTVILLVDFLPLAHERRYATRG
jgi:hypothetical protein